MPDGPEAVHLTAYSNAHAERWIGSCRRECLDRMLILNQRHLEAVLGEAITPKIGPSR